MNAFRRPRHRGASESPQSCDAHHEVTASRQRLVALKPWTAEAPAASRTTPLRTAIVGPAFSAQRGLQVTASGSATPKRTKAPPATSVSITGAARDSVHPGTSPVDGDGGARTNKAEHPCANSEHAVAIAVRRRPLILF